MILCYNENAKYGRREDYDLDLEANNGRYYTIKSNITSNGIFYLDVASPSSGANAKVKLWYTNVNPEERWTILPNGNGTYCFVNGYDGLYMDILAGSTSATADVQIHPYIGTLDQFWYVNRAN